MLDCRPAFLFKYKLYNDRYIAVSSKSGFLTEVHVYNFI